MIKNFDFICDLATCERNQNKNKKELVETSGGVIKGGGERRDENINDLSESPSHEEPNCMHVHNHNPFVGIIVNL